ncbi:MAG: hypothetical protein QXP27_06940 [Candidatus Methanomethyliaceae archaeon]
MADWLYADYLEIDQDFIDVYKEEEDRKRPGAWKSLIPQENMRELLEKIIGALERKAPKPPFIYGPYGTGKTLTAFALKHLLEDDMDEVEAYFAKYSSIKDLWPRWRALREQGPFLVVYRSSSSDARTPFRLAYILQERISHALAEKGYKSCVTETLRQEVLRNLTDPQSTFNWAVAFKKHRFRFRDCATPEEVIARLQGSTNSSPETELGLVDLTERVIQTLEEEHFVVLYTPESLKKWIKEIIERNNLKGLLFLWDEFTDFFAIPGAPIDIVQELAHLAAETPFYLGLISHQAPDIAVKVDQESRAKFLERFHTHHLQLTDVTAYRLMGGVLQVKPERRDEWERKRQRLWDKVEKVSFLLMGLQGETKGDMQNLVPIHPYTARLLAAIARQFSSSQRTLFRFLKEEKPGRFTFPRFLREHPQDDWFWLTADYLWDYFYAEDDPDYSEEVRRFIAQYRTNVEKIEDPVERRIYKSVLLLDLIYRRVGARGQDERSSLEPTRSRLELVYEGVLDRSQVRAALDSLCGKRLLYRYAVGKNEGYTLPLSMIDENKVKEIKENIEKATHFRDLARETGEIGQKLSERLGLRPPLRNRQRLRLASVEELGHKQERVLPERELEPYQVGVVVVLPFEESELRAAREYAQKLSSENQRVIYAVAEQVFGKQRWDEWLEQKALTEYSRELGEKDNVQSYNQRAQRLVEEWIEGILTRGFQMYFRGRKATFVAGPDGYEKFFEEVVAEIYPLRPESIFTIEPLYTGSFGQQAARIGLGLESKPPNPFAYAVERLERQGLWGSKDWPTEHPLAQMKAKINEALEEHGKICVKDAWETLMGPPYGLMPSRIGVMLFAFLLRDYKEGYYYYDGNRCEGLNAQTLTTIIDSVIKGSKGPDYEIRKMLPAEERACALLRELFTLPPEETRYLRSTLIALRSRLKSLGYPLWALCYTSEGPCPEELSSCVETLQMLLAGNLEASLPEREQVYNLARQLSEARKYLRELASRKSSYEAGMRRFIEQNNHALMEAAIKLELSMERLVEKLRTLLQEDVAFWDENKVKEQLGRLYDECRVTIALNELFGGSARELSSALHYLRREWIGSFGKLPLWLLAEVADEEDKDALELLRELFEARSFDPARDFERVSNWAKRARVLVEQKEKIRRNLKSQQAALCLWVQKHLEVSLSSTDAGQLLAKTPSLLEARHEEVVNYVRRYLAELERQQLILTLRQCWQEITGTPSPGEWSQMAGLPAHLLVDRNLEHLLELLDHPEKKSEDELREAQKTLEKEKEVLRWLCDKEWVKKTFLERVARDYAVLVEDEGDFIALKEHLRRELGGQLLQWDLARAQKATEEWAKEYYSKIGYRRVEDRLRELSEEEAKKLLGELARDPRVGILLLRRS